MTRACPHCQAIARGRLNRLGIIILRKGGMNQKSIRSLLKISGGRMCFFVTQISQKNGVKEAAHFGAHFATTPQRDWVL